MSILIVERDEKKAQKLADTITAPVQLLPAFPSKEEGNARTIIIGPSADPQAVLDAASQRSWEPSSKVIWVREDLDTDVVLAAMRSGMHDVVVDLTDLNNAVLRAQNTTPVAIPRGTDNRKVVCTFAPKGGDGKTTVSTALASELQKNGARAVIVDLDLEFGDVAVTMSVRPQHTIADVARIDGMLDATAVNQLLTAADNGVQVLAAPAAPHEAAAVNASHVEQLIDILAEQFDVVVIDCPPSVTTHVLAAWDRTDELVLVTLPVITSLNCAAGALASIRSLKIDKTAQLRLVVNRAGISEDPTVSDIEKALGVKAVAALPQDNEVTSALNRGDVFTDTYPDHELTIAINKLARTVYPQLPEPTVAPNSAGRRRFFSRRKVEVS